MITPSTYSTRTPDELWRIGQSLFRERRYADARNITADISELALNSAQVTRHGDRPQAALEVSVVVVSSRASPLTERCLKAIRTDLADAAGEIILVDNGGAALLGPARKVLDRFTHVRLSENMGASVGRNVGARLSESDNVVFVDDDGILCPDSIKAFLDIRRETGCSFVRGKVLPLRKSPKGAPAHYDLGDYRRPYFLNCEGIACVDREVFLSVGGFDPLLFGHEGVELCARAWRFIGPSGFYYEPSAVLLHDYADSVEKLEAKKARYKLMDEYLALHAPTTMEIYKPYRNSFNGDHRSVYSTFVSPGRASASHHNPISVITTAWNAAHVIEDYAKCWTMQQYPDFEVVFVDDGSEDGTADLLQEITDGDDRFRIVRSEKVGRGAALNLAISEARHDVFAVADVDDLSVPQRLSLIDREMQRSGADIVSFITFNEQNMSRQGGFPQSAGFNDFLVRSLFGMPGQFPSYAFRRSAVTVPFSKSLKGGVDCDWLRRVLEEPGRPEVRLVQIPVVYYRQSSGQISQSHRAAQKQSRERLIFSSYGRVLGELTSRDRDVIRALSIDRRLSGFDLNEIVAWSNEFTRKNRLVQYFHDENLCWALSDAVHHLAASPAQNPKKPGAKSGKIRAALSRKEKFDRELRRLRNKGRLLLRNPGLGDR